MPLPLANPPPTLSRPSQLRTPGPSICFQSPACHPRPNDPPQISSLASSPKEDQAWSEIRSAPRGGSRTFPLPPKMAPSAESASVTKNDTSLLLSPLPASRCPEMKPSMLSGKLGETGILWVIRAFSVLELQVQHLSAPLVPRQKGFPR